MANSVEGDWDEGSPVISQSRRAGALEINSLRKAVRLRMAKEHITLAASPTGGEHKAGSAVSYYQADAPTLRPDGATSLGSADAGRIWIDSDTKYVYIWTGSAWTSQLIPSPAINIYQFEKTDGSLWPPSTTLQKTGLTPGTYIVWVEGTTINGTGSTAFTTSVTVNGITRTVVIDNVPDGTAPFSISLQITVVGDGLCTLSAASNVARIMKMFGFLTVAS